MHPSYKLKKTQVARILSATFPDYTGRKFSIEFRPTVTFYDLNWGGGTRNVYCAIRTDGSTAEIPHADYFNPIEGKTVELPEDVLIVEHSVFCGQDSGIRLYAHPCHMPKWITAA